MKVSIPIKKDKKYIPTLLKIINPIINLSEKDRSLLAFFIASTDKVITSDIKKKAVEEKIAASRADMYNYLKRLINSGAVIKGKGRGEYELHPTFIKMFSRKDPLISKVTIEFIRNEQV